MYNYKIIKGNYGDGAGELYNYNVQVWYNGVYSGIGRFTKTLDDAAAFIASHAGAVSDNLINDGNDDMIGFYPDIKKYYNRIIKEYVDDGDLESAGDMMAELKDVDEYKNYTGLLILSENNGMGFTCKKYTGKECEE